MTSTVELDVGPVAPASAVAWMEWAEQICAELRDGPPSRTTFSAEALDGIEGYFERWMPQAHVLDQAFRWRAKIDPDELEYLLCTLFRLDARLDARQGQRRPAYDEGRVFFLVLVRALLHSLETESPGRAAFADQLRAAWPSAAEAS